MGLWGTDDLAITEPALRDTSNYVAGGWWYERIQDAGHWPMLEATSTVNSLLLDFLAETAPTDPQRTPSGSPTSRFVRAKQ